MLRGDLPVYHLFHSHVYMAETDELFWSGEEMTNMNPTNSDLKL